MKINRINSKNSFYTIQLEDKEDKPKGIYLTEIKEDKSKGSIYPVETYISTLIYSQLKVKSEDCIYYKVVYFDGDNERFRFIKANNLFSDGYNDTDDIKYLINNGLLISHKCKHHLIDFLKCQAREVSEIQGTDKTGWHETGEYIANGFSTTKNILFTGYSSFQFKQNGSKELYYETVRDIFVENPLVFAICSYSASAYLLGILNNEVNQALSLNGTSSKGKSTVGKLALSFATNPQNFHGLDSTKGNIQSILKHSNHNFVFFDEVAESNLKIEDKKNLVYALANGSQKGRLQKSADLGEYVTNAKNEEKLKYTVLLAGENSFLQGIKIDGTGIDARYLEIVLPDGVLLWDSIRTAEDAEGLNQFIHKNYGFLAPDLISKIKERKEELSLEYEKKLFQIREELGETNGIIKRKVRILAYTYVTAVCIGEILFEDYNAAVELADNSLIAFKNAIIGDNIKNEDDIYKETLSHIESSLIRYLEDYDYIDDSKTLIKKFGYYKINESFKELSIISNCFTEMCNVLGIDEKLFISYLISNNLLVSDKDRHTKKMTFNKARANYYNMKIPQSFFESKSQQTKNSAFDNNEDEDLPY